MKIKIQNMRIQSSQIHNKLKIAIRSCIVFFLVSISVACGHPSNIGKVNLQTWEYSVGNRSALYFGDCCEFEAKNTIPVTWLALFSSDDFVIEKQQEDDEEYEIALFVTTRSKALERVQAAIDNLKGNTAIWAYLRPLEILRDELEFCSSVETIQLDVTQFWAVDEEHRQIVIDGPSSFLTLVREINNEETNDLSMLDKLIGDQTLNPITTVAELHPEDKMFVLIGTYWGEHEDQYTLDTFGKDYWQVGQ